MRFRLADPSSANYLNKEAWLNNIKLISVNSGTELVLGVSIVDSSGNQILSLSTSPVVGQAKIAITGTAVQLTAGALQNGVIISDKSGNTASIEIGTSSVNNTVDGTGNGLILAAGASISFAVDNVNRLYINGIIGDIVSWAGS